MRRRRHQIVPTLIKACDLVPGDVIRNPGRTGGDGWSTVDFIVRRRVRGARREELIEKFPEVGGFLRAIHEHGVLAHLVPECRHKFDLPLSGELRLMRTAPSRDSAWEVYDRHELVEIQLEVPISRWVIDYELPDDDE